MRLTLVLVMASWWCAGGAQAGTIQLVLWRDRGEVRASEEVESQIVSVIEKSGLPVLEAGVEHLPATCELGEVRAAVDVARATPGADLIVARIRDTAFREVDKAGYLKVVELEPLLRWLAVQPDIEVVAAGAVAGPGLSYGRERLYRELKEKGVPFGLYRDELLTYPTAIRLDRMRQVGRTVAVLPFVVGALILTGLMIGLFFLRRKVRRRRVREAAAETGTGD